jgi:hypothetical protein
VQAARTRGLQPGSQQRASDAGSLMGRIDEQQIDLRPLGSAAPAR